MTKQVDIVVPIYNAYEYTTECIESLIKYTDLSNHRLILINDKSPDEKILPMLMRYASENLQLNIIVLNNEVNLGFVGTVNKGMEYSKNDVVLLNSDTEVTNKWLDKIIKCAYSRDEIATVTALSNNATLASVPNFGVDNEIPNEFTINEYAQMIEEISYNAYPEVVTGNGFCIYIKRKVIDEIGVFDHKTFGKGYGEENDFCYRALDYGYVNVLCDNTFIYHKGTQSFTGEKQKLCEAHLKIIEERYPHYYFMNNIFVTEVPTRKIHDNVRINIKAKNKKNILYIVHEWMDDNNNYQNGGTTLHILDIINNIKDEYNCFVFSLTSKKDTYKLYSYINDELHINTFTINKGYNLLTFYNLEYKKLLSRLIKDLNVDIVHVHHGLWHTFDISDCTRENDVYSIITLHDYYYICPSINMLYNDEKYCELMKNRDCKYCLEQKRGFKNLVIDKWQEESNKFLKKFDMIITPSEDTKNLFNNYYKEIEITPIEHGMDFSRFHGREMKIGEHEGFNIAFLGNMTVHKGSNILEYLIKNTKNRNIKYHVFGGTDIEFLKSNKDNYIFHGKYDRDSIIKILKENNIDLVCLFSIWPETYSYTLSESILAEIPVISYNIGAISERLTRNNAGWIVDIKEDIKNIVSKVEEIYQNKDEYEVKKQNATKMKILNIDEMVNEYKNIYGQVFRKREYNSYNFQDIIFENKINDSMHNQANYSNSVIFVEKMKNSKSWKLLKKIKLDKLFAKVIKKI